MATGNINQQCSMCNVKNDTYDCNGCKKSFCFTHLLEHRENIKQEFHQIENIITIYFNKILLIKKMLRIKIY